VSDEAALAAVDCYLLDPEAPPDDEDEAIVQGESPADLRGVSATWVVCVGCGGMWEEESPGKCTCPAGTLRVKLYEVATAKQSHQRCVMCGARNPNGTVFRMLTGKDAPVSVLATSLYQALPPAEGAAELPGQGRKLLSFADSRQDAAFFAPYLERTYQNLLRRRMIMRALSADAEARSGGLRLEDLAHRLHTECETSALFPQDESHDANKRRCRLWLMQELVSTSYRIGPEGLGLLCFRPVHPPRWEPPSQLLHPPWNLTAEQAWTLCQVLVDMLRRQGAVAYPEGVDPRDDAFKPRNVSVYAGQVANASERVLGWIPAVGSNGRASYLARLLARTGTVAGSPARNLVTDTLQGLWRHLTDPQSPWRPFLDVSNSRGAGVRYRLKHGLWEWVPVEDTGIPTYCCDHCGNVFYTNLLEVCPTHNCDGRLQAIEDSDAFWRDNHYRHLYRSLDTIALEAEEHTAQWKPDEAGRVQDRFVRGITNVLSCSTTFELGVDVGSLQAVLMRNVPPTAANYVQRAGRAGRRTDSVALVLTYAQRRSHDLSHFREPYRLVGGHVPPPRIHLLNERIVRRHMHAVLLAAFFRWAQAVHGYQYPSVGAFFEAVPSDPTGSDLLRRYAESRPAEVQNALERIVPQELQLPLGIPTWEWVTALTNGEQAGLLDLVQSEVEGDLQFYTEEMDKAASARRFDLAGHFDRVAKTVRNQDLPGFLASRNVLPKYGFPTDVVELRTEHLSEPDATRLELQRDLRVAISEYAPGSEVVAAKKVWQSGGLCILRGRDWQTWHYAICPQCQRFQRSVSVLPEVCGVCGARLTSSGALHGDALWPQFGFVAGRTVRPAEEARPERIYGTRTYFCEYGREDAEPDRFVSVEDLCRHGCLVSHHYSRYGLLAVVNPGHGRGFRICTSCGWAEPVVVPPPKGDRSHRNPRTNRDCAGKITTYHLGHTFMTDVLELRLSSPGSMIRAGYDAWESALAAVLEGACRSLEIPRDDLGGTLYPYERDAPPALILYDNVPGGAGYVREVADRLRTVIRAAYDVADRCACGPETSCYECLRSYYNQYAHDRLQRGLARDLLSAYVDGSAGKAASA